MGNKSKATLLTMIFSVLSSIIQMLLNLIYNNFLIATYGSNVNGLISTLTQFVSLFTVLEGGFTTAAIVSVYKPIVEKDFNALNNILYTAKVTFQKIGLIIALGVLILGSGYIFIIDSTLTYRDTYILLIISVMSATLSICALSKYNILLQGDNKEYKLINDSLVQYGNINNTPTDLSDYYNKTEVDKKIKKLNDDIDFLKRVIVHLTGANLYGINENEIYKLDTVVTQITSDKNEISVNKENHTVYLDFNPNVLGNITDI